MISGKTLFMGGIGSGRRWHYGTKHTVDGWRAIDIRHWQREGLLIPGNTFHWQWLWYAQSASDLWVSVEADRLMLSFVSPYNGTKRKDLDFSVALETTQCTYGGVRYWFRCPAEGCGRRVAKLYDGGRHFACRPCYDLVYPSQRENPSFRAGRRASKIRKKMGGSGALNTKLPDKPKGMHWRTYLKLRQQAEEFGGQFTTGLNQQIKVLESLSTRLLDNAKKQIRES